MNRCLQQSRLALVLLGCAACAAPSPSTLKGHYYFGAEVESFNACTSSEHYWVEGSEDVLGPLRDLANQLADEQGEIYQPLFVEIFATEVTDTTNTAARAYDGVYRIDSVVQFRAGGPADCAELIPTTDAGSAAPMS